MPKSVAPPAPIDPAPDLLNRANGNRITEAPGNGDDDTLFINIAERILFEVDRIDCSPAIYQRGLRIVMNVLHRALTTSIDIDGTAI